jgi:preprotein translocase subunit SecY
VIAVFSFRGHIKIRREHMLRNFLNRLKAPDMRDKILITIGIMIVYRVTGQVTVPGVDEAVLREFFVGSGLTVFGLYDLFVGGAFTRATVFALGIIPYISAAILVLLISVGVAFFRRLRHEGEEARLRIKHYTRYCAVLLAAAQALAVGYFLESIRGLESGLFAVADPGWSFRVLTMLTITSGTVFVMWLSEQISKRGIGNGI